MDESEDISNPTIQQFLNCPIQQLACNTLINEILDCELLWSKNKTQQKIPDNHPQMTLWQNAIKRIVRQLLLYGFVVYRMAKISAPSSTDLVSMPSVDDKEEDKSGKGMALEPDALKSQPSGPSFKLEIMSGNDVCLKWIKKTACFVAVSRLGDPARPSFQARQGNFDIGKPNQWRLQLLDPPMRVGKSVTTQQSAAARAYASSVLHSKLMQHVQSRDEMNTRPSVFTAVSDRIKTGAGSQLKPWFDATTAHNAMVTQGGHGASALDFEQVVENRLQTITTLQEMSAKARENTRRMYADAVNPMGMRSLHEPPPPEQNHEEYLITDGMQFAQVDYRRAPEDLLQLLDRTSNDVLFQYSVPPQVLGKNINSERLASSNRLSELAVRKYSVSVKIIRDNLQICLENISAVIGDGASLVMNPCISTFTLNQLTPILKTEAAIKLHACAYDVNPDIFSKKAMEEYLQLQRQGGKSDGIKKEDIKSTIDVEEAKLKKARTKALKPSASTDSKT